MKDILYLYHVAESDHIPVLHFYLPENGSLCVQDGSGRCFIGIDEEHFEIEADRYVRLGHELGHCETGAFYNRWAAKDERQQHEIRADKWSIEQLVPMDEFDDAIASGYTELWELADFFGVTEDFIRKAACWYIHGNLDVAHYMNF